MRRFLLEATKAFRRDDGGATSIEYGLIVALIFLVIVASVRSVSGTTSEMYSQIESAVRNR